MPEKSKPEKITVALGKGRSYDILVGRGLLAQAGGTIAPLVPGKRVIIVTDRNVAKHGHCAVLQKSLAAKGIRSDTITLPSGEGTKSFANLEKLLDKLLAFHPDRRTTLIALGGGVIGDITGFAASILLRGVPFIQVPTTLLAMVDSSVGGKTGINTKFGKNLVGSFYQPKLVLADLATLDTLPKREVLAGYAEVLKYGLINNRKFFEKLEKSKLQKILQECVVTSCKAKADIVAQDEKEADVRALLNLGHTFGHALEAEMGYDGRLLHGEGVAAGMAMAFRFSASLGQCPKTDAERIEKHLKAAGLPFCPKCIGSFSAKKLLAHMKHDKKVQDGKLVLILAKGIGKAFIEKNVSEKDVKRFLEQETGKA